MSSKSKIALAGILLVALGLRLWGIRFGLPYVYHYDEHFYVNTALNLGAGVLNNPPYAPVGLSNILFPQYAAYFLLGRMQGTFVTPQQFEAAYRSDPTVFYLLARLTSAVLGALIALPIFWLVRALRPERPAATGLVAAGLAAVSFLQVRDGHFGVPDVAMSFAVTLAVSIALMAVHRRSCRLMCLAGLAAGAAISIKWTALPVALPVLLSSLVVNPKTGMHRGSTARRYRLLVTALCVALGFALTSPQIILNPGPYVHEAFGQVGAGQAGGFEIWQVDTLPGWLFYVKVLGYGLGIPLLILAAAGLIARLADVFLHRRAQSALLVLFPLSYFLLMGATRHYFARYALPLVPFAAVFVGDVIAWVTDRLSLRDRRLATVVASVLVLAAISEPLASSVRHDVLLTRSDTRTLAKEWIEANLPAGARIAMDWQTHGPPLATADNPAPGATRVFDVLVVGGTGLADHPIVWYRENGFDYLISSSFISEIPLVYAAQDEARRMFYALLPEELELIRTFIPTGTSQDAPFIFDEIYGPAISLWQRERPGPTLKIFRVQ